MNPTTSTNGGGTPAPTFDPRPYLRPLNGKQYLEVVHRLQWLRAEHPDAIITTSLQHFDWEAGWFIFHARVEIPGLGAAEGTGSETRAGFPGGPCEKAETIAVGRALAALGYGTAFCLDFETADANGTGHLADSPVERPNGTNGNGQQQPPSANGTTRPAGSGNGTGSLATPAQIRLLNIRAQAAGIDLEAHVQARHGKSVYHLTKAEASALIDSMPAGATRR